MVGCRRGKKPLNLIASRLTHHPLPQPSPMKTFLPALLGALMISAAGADQGPSDTDIQTRDVMYQDDETDLQGFIAAPADTSIKRPGVLVVHQWMGLTDYEQRRCRMLAQLGYVAFALDIYGQGVRPTTMEAAAGQAGIYKGDRDLYRQRLALGLEQLRSQPGVDPNRIAAIGYCFGGTGVLELARSGADVDGVVSFHGGLGTPTPADAENITAKVLACHGVDDPFVPAEEVVEFVKEMNDADVDYQFISYSNTVHSFTQPSAGDDPSKGFSYNPTSDARSWAAMQVFFKELFPTIELAKPAVNHVLPGVETTIKLR